MFYKEKGFYISLICGIVALLAFGGICANLLSSNKANENKIVAEGTQKPITTQAPKTKEASINKAKSEVKEPKKKSKEKKVVKETASKNVKNRLSFDEEAGLLWPVKGNVLMQYSKNQVVFFKTLQQYRTNPALIISAKENANVKASANGVVKDIFTSEESGRTLVMEIGNDYTVSYGQLKEITVNKGDYISEGQVIGKVAAPTKYYCLEGTNLYYQVKEKNATVNPMLLLK